MSRANSTTQTSGIRELLAGDATFQRRLAYFPLTKAAYAKPIPDVIRYPQPTLLLCFLISLPRRHRRKLLFPPGLLALAGLLWLGVVAIGPWQEKLTKRSVLQLTMPPKPVSDTIYQSNSYPITRTIPFLYSQLFNLYTWQDIELNGNAAHDSTAVRAIAQGIEKLRNDTLPNGGVRVRIRPSARYKELVRLLDLMNECSQEKYLVDIHHGPTTLYALVDSYTPQPSEPKHAYFICGTNAYLLPLIPPQPQQSVSDKWLQLLRQPEWRASVCLLAAIMALGSWRMVWPRHSV